MTLKGKDEAAIEKWCSDKTHAELVAMIKRMASVDDLLKPRELAIKEGRNKSAVVRDMRAGKYVDPLFGPGYFAFVKNSLRTSAAAANDFRKRFFVAVKPQRNGSSVS